MKGSPFVGQPRGLLTTLNYYGESVGAKEEEESMWVKDKQESTGDEKIGSVWEKCNEEEEVGRVEG